ncbi:MAG: alpha/beta hydrolase [Pseudomonadota bacterium]|nr:alpha/beta hydrolase [Pseudomonadota bacterium]
MAFVKANGIEIEVEDFGDKSNPAVLLIMGLSAQLTLWPTAFVDALVARGFRVIRFDNRDIGLSQKMHEARALSPFLFIAAARLFGAQRLAPYTLHDMAADAVGVLDALGVESAHVVGASMGGMIGQIVAAAYPGRVRSFTAIMSSTNNPALPKAEASVLKALFAKRPPAKSRDELIDRSVEAWNIIGTRDGGNDPVEFRKRIAANVDRCTYPAGVRRQVAAIVATGDLRRWTRAIAAPTLVIHGSADPLAPNAGGRDIAANVEDAKLEIIDGMGHDLPPKHLPKITELVADHLKSAEEKARDSRAA